MRSGWIAPNSCFGYLEARFAETVDIGATFGPRSGARDGTAPSSPKFGLWQGIRLSTSARSNAPSFGHYATGLGRNVSEYMCACDKYDLPRMMGGDTHRANHWMRKVSVAMEALSRLVLRLETDKIEVAFDKALEYYRDSRTSQRVGLGRAVENLLKRSWEALPEERRAVRVLDLLSSPIVGLDGFGDRPFSSSPCPDPGSLLQDKNTLPQPDRTSSNVIQWQEIVSLLVRGLEVGGTARVRASHRLMPVAYWGHLTEDESYRVSQALWSETYTDPDDLPSEALLLDWELLLLPEPEPGLAEQRFRHKWLAASGAPQENEPSLDDVLLQIGAAISGLKDTSVH